VALPSTLEPTAIHFAGCLMRTLLADARFDELKPHERRAMVEDGVRRIMAAGAYVRDGRMYLPSGTTEAHL